MADGGHIKYRNISNISVLDAAHNFVQSCNTGQTMDKSSKIAFSQQCIENIVVVVVVVAVTTNQCSMRRNIARGFCDS